MNARLYDATQESNNVSIHWTYIANRKLKDRNMNNVMKVRHCWNEAYVSLAWMFIINNKTLIVLNETICEFRRHL